MHARKRGARELLDRLSLAADDCLERAARRGAFRVHLGILLEDVPGPLEKWHPRCHELCLPWNGVAAGHEWHQSRVLHRTRPSCFDPGRTLYCTRVVAIHVHTRPVPNYRSNQLVRKACLTGNGTCNADRHVRSGPVVPLLSQVCTQPYVCAASHCIVECRASGPFVPLPKLIFTTPWSGR